MTLEMPARRLLFNELVETLRRTAPARLEDITSHYPDLALDIRAGPVAGRSVLSATKRQARFSLEIATAAIESVASVSDKMMARSAAAGRSQLWVALIAGLSGATMLTAFGLAKDEIARISGMATAVLAVLNSAIDTLVKRYAAAQMQKALEARAKSMNLRVLVNKLQALVLAAAADAELTDAVNACNELALELNRLLDQLRLV